MKNEQRAVMFAAHVAMFNSRRTGVGASPKDVESAILAGYMAAMRCGSSSESDVFAALAWALERWVKGCSPSDAWAASSVSSCVLLFAEFVAGLRTSGVVSACDVPVGVPALPDDLLSEEEASQLLHVKRGTLQVWRCTKRYPLAYVKIGRLVKYRRSDLNEFLRKRTVDMIS
jgi:hypothetical protein